MPKLYGVLAGLSAIEFRVKNAKTLWSFGWSECNRV